MLTYIKSVNYMDFTLPHLFAKFLRDDIGPCLIKANYLRGTGI